jgi:hypothetical protein
MVYPQGWAALVDEECVYHNATVMGIVAATQALCSTHFLMVLAVFLRQRRRSTEVQTWRLGVVYLSTSFIRSLVLVALSVLHQLDNQLIGRDRSVTLLWSIAYALFLVELSINATTFQGPIHSIRTHYNLPEDSSFLLSSRFTKGVSPLWTSLGGWASVVSSVRFRSTEGNVTFMLASVMVSMIMTVAIFYAQRRAFLAYTKTWFLMLELRSRPMVVNRFLHNRATAHRYFMLIIAFCLAFSASIVIALSFSVLYSGMGYVFVLFCPIGVVCEIANLLFVHVSQGAVKRPAPSRVRTSAQLLKDILNIKVEAASEMMNELMSETFTVGIFTANAPFEEFQLSLETLVAKYTNFETGSLSRSLEPTTARPSRSSRRKPVAFSLPHLKATPVSLFAFPTHPPDSTNPNHPTNPPYPDSSSTNPTIQVSDGRIFTLSLVEGTGALLPATEVIKPGSHAFVRVVGENYLRVGAQSFRFGAACGHLALSGNKPVLCAGEIKLGKHGRISLWNNKSGTYRPPARYAGQSGLPVDSFVAWHRGEQYAKVPLLITTGALMERDEYREAMETLQQRQLRRQLWRPECLETNAQVKEVDLEMFMRTHKARQQMMNDHGFTRSFPFTITHASQLSPASFIMRPRRNRKRASGPGLRSAAKPSGSPRLSTASRASRSRARAPWSPTRHSTPPCPVQLNLRPMHLDLCPPLTRVPKVDSPKPGATMVTSVSA